ncbi:MAG: TM2 domain-containing protein [Alphaproteobacteria bacterium]|nr:TM2 domain-containing protein [Alphaproteobacteria bacterium]
MDYITTTKFIEQNDKNLFPNKEYTKTEIVATLSTMPDETTSVLNKFPMRNPKIAQVLALFGLDRYYLGDIVKGLIKSMTLNGFMIWWVVDIFTAQSRCRTYNCKNLMKSLSDPSIAQNLIKQEETIQNGINTAKKYAPVAKEIVKGAKSIRDSFGDIN